MITKRHALHALINQDFGHAKSLHYSVAYAAPIHAAAPSRNRRLLEEFLLGQARSGLRQMFRDAMKSDKQKPASTPAEDSASAGQSLEQGFFATSFDQMLATSLVQGPLTSGVLRGFFGLVPSLIGR